MGVVMLQCVDAWVLTVHVCVTIAIPPYCH